MNPSVRDMRESVVMSGTKRIYGLPPVGGVRKSARTSITHHKKHALVQGLTMAYGPTKMFSPGSTSAVQRYEGAKRRYLSLITDYRHIDEYIVKYLGLIQDSIQREKEAKEVYYKNLKERNERIASGRQAKSVTDIIYEMNAIRGFRTVLVDKLLEFQQSKAVVRRGLVTLYKFIIAYHNSGGYTLEDPPTFVDPIMKRADADEHSV